MLSQNPSYKVNHQIGYKVMETEALRHFYRLQLLKSGMDTQRAEQISQSHSREQLQLICQILPERIEVFLAN